MKTAPHPSVAASVGRGMLAGVAGTGVMTAVQKLVEMPLTGRRESYVPAMLAERLLPIGRQRGKRRRQLNYVAHFSLGLMWGAAYGFAAHKGLRGQRAVGAVFGAVYPGDVLFSAAVGVYDLRKWTAQSTAIDVAGKFVQAEATGVIYDNLLADRRAEEAVPA